MSNNNIKVALTYDDTSVSIAVFNEISGLPNILFNDRITLQTDSIKKGFIINTENVLDTTKILLNKACNFTKLNITKVYATFETSKDIEVNLAEINETTLEDGVFDKQIWEKVKSTINVSQVTERYIYDLSYHSWKIDGKEYHDLPATQIFGKKLVIKTNVYKVNKVLHHQYENIIKQLGITPIWIKPVVGTLNSLTSSTKSSNAELFIYLNDQSLMLFHAYGDKITRIDNFAALGLETLYNTIANDFNLDANYVKQILTSTCTHGNSLNAIELINGYNLNNSTLTKVDGKALGTYIDNFAQCIVECKNECIKFVNKNKGIEFNKITFVPKDQLTSKIINITQIRNDSRTSIYTSKYFIDGDESYNQLALTIDHIIDLDKHTEQKINCIDTTTNKSFIGFLKGE